jgi:hypothetical protein
VRTIDLTVVWEFCYSKIWGRKTDVDEG